MGDYMNCFTPIYWNIYISMYKKIYFNEYKNNEKLPSISQLCKIYNTSDKTIRLVLKMLKNSKMIKTSKGKAAVVIYNRNSYSEYDSDEVRELSENILNNVIGTLKIIYAPLFYEGMKNCNKNNLIQLENVINYMEENIYDDLKVIALNKEISKIVTRQINNKFIDFILNHLFFFSLVPISIDYKDCIKIYVKYKNIIKLMKLESFDFKDIHIPDISPYFFKLIEKYDFMLDKKFRYYDEYGNLKILIKSEFMYKSIYLDILNQILMKRYKQYDFLPSEAALGSIYNVSSITVKKAVKTLKEMNIVNPVKGKGIQIIISYEDLKKRNLNNSDNIMRLKVHTESMQFLAITSKSSAQHIYKYISQREAYELYDRFVNEWEKNPGLYSCLSFVLLDFMIKHIQYSILKDIYENVKCTFYYGLYIQGRFGDGFYYPYKKRYKMCLTIVQELKNRNKENFSEGIKNFFESVYNDIINSCKRAGIWEDIENFKY